MFRCYSPNQKGFEDPKPNIGYKNTYFFINPGVLATTIFQWDVALCSDFEIYRPLPCGSIDSWSMTRECHAGCYTFEEVRGKSSELNKCNYTRKQSLHAEIPILAFMAMTDAGQAWQPQIRATFELGRYNHKIQNSVHSLAASFVLLFCKNAPKALKLCEWTWCLPLRLMRPLQIRAAALPVWFAATRLRLLPIGRFADKGLTQSNSLSIRTPCILSYDASPCKWCDFVTLFDFRLWITHACDIYVTLSFEFSMYALFDSQCSTARVVY